MLIWLNNPVWEIVVGTGLAGVVIMYSQHQYTLPEHTFLAILLIIIALIYARFAWVDGRPTILFKELIGIALFFAMAWLTGYVPSWYPLAYLAFDEVIAV